MSTAERPPAILLVLPLAYQDGRDKYVGFLRYVSETRRNWNIRLEREQPALPRLRQSLKDGVDAVVLDGFVEAAACRSRDQETEGS